MLSGGHRDIRVAEDLVAVMVDNEIREIIIDGSPISGGILKCILDENGRAAGLTNIAVPVTVIAVECT